MYNSIQGEGLRMGTPTMFLRFAGCNMRCPGWPCDTPHAIEPSIWVKESEKFEIKQLVKRIQDTTGTGVTNICWTGGEPFIQPIEQLERLYWELADKGYTQEVFTNGSVIFPDFTDSMLKMMDWKLAGSGEDSFNVSEREYNAFENLGPDDGIKFVIVDKDDYEEAMHIWRHLAWKVQCQAQFWVGAAWGRIKEAQLVEWILEDGLPWKLNVQVHKYIWPADKRGV